MEDNNGVENELRVKRKRTKRPIDEVKGCRTNCRKKKDLNSDSTITAETSVDSEVYETTVSEDGETSVKGLLRCTFGHLAVFANNTA